MPAAEILLIPGLGNSGPTHWESVWEARHPEYRRVVQHEWDQPDRDEWVRTLDRYVRAGTAPKVLVAHSLGCALVAHWARGRDTNPVVGALLVAPSDVDSPAHMPPETRGFAPMPLERLPFRALVIASTNDPYVDLARAEAFALAWGARFENAGALGHINADSQLGAWPDGQAYLAALLVEV
jgi:predicted alpha/beta hydrolase family esterase